MTLSKRRHRNLTASISNSFSSSLIIQNKKSLLDQKSIKQQQQQQKQQGLSTDDYLEKFLDSLQDINNYLDKKLSQSSLSAQQQLQRPAATNPNASNKVCSSINNNNNNNNKANKLADKRTRRNLTQPIFLNNDLYRFSLER